jgi:photosystem II stability/assembly factor-like uncharacterized protein
MGHCSCSMFLLGPILEGISQVKDHWTSMNRQKLSSGHGMLLAALALLIIGGVSSCGNFPPSASPPVSSPGAQVRPTVTARATAVSSVSQRFVGRGIDLENGLYMASAQVGWARPYTPTGHGSLFRTTDGGRGWKQITIPQEPAGWSFLLNVFDEDMAFLQPFQPGNTGTVFPCFYRTVDGGTTWQRCNWPTTPEIKRLGVGALSLTFLDHTRGWVVLSPSDQSTRTSGSKRTLSPSREAMLFHTTDGGKTWQPLLHLPPTYAGSLAFMDSQTGRFSTALDGSQRSDGSSEAVLYVTHDGGSTWKPSSALPLPAQETSKPSTIDTLPFSTPYDGYLTVSFGKTDAHIARYLYATQDGGNTWRVEGAALPTNPTYELNVVDTTHIDDGYFLFTLSNGQWVQTSSAPVGGDVTRWRVEFLSPQVGVALVDGTDVYKTGDRGLNWQRISALPKS